MKKKKENDFYEEITYLSGPIDRAPDGGIGWRQRITPELEAMGIKVQNPIMIACKILAVSSIRANREKLRRLRLENRTKWRKIFRKIRRAHRKAVLNSHFIIVNWDWRISTYGTSIENYVAAENGIPIYCVANAPTDALPNGLLEDVERSGGGFFNSFEELLFFLKLRKKIIQQRTKDLPKPKVRNLAPN